MPKNKKLITRFKTRPKDFTWVELTSMLNHLGFVEIRGSGSRVKFYHEENDCLIHLHKPHPSKILKAYVVKSILSTLEQEGLI
ncbi:MAG: type II toxin-antitoxin system HicA family toxin [Gammaproteobacteria bacterium]|jgi:predicted RNA binding protein YcfA (HicA-like mRNA interferase family)